MPCRSALKRVISYPAASAGEAGVVSVIVTTPLPVSVGRSSRAAARHGSARLGWPDGIVQARISAAPHALRTIGERRRSAWLATEPHPDLVFSPQRPVPCALALACMGETITTPA